MAEIYYISFSESILYSYVRYCLRKLSVDGHSVTEILCIAYSRTSNIRFDLHWHYLGILPRSIAIRCWYFPLFHRGRIRHVVLFKPFPCPPQLFIVRAVHHTETLHKRNLFHGNHIPAQLVLRNHIQARFVLVNRISEQECERVWQSIRRRGCWKLQQTHRTDLALVQL